MAPTDLIVLLPDRETPAFNRQVGRFHYRAAYSRSTDSRNNNEPGQDYLTFRSDGDRFAFALCDGVSQSFYGDLAACILGDKLLEWVWTIDFRLPRDSIQKNLILELNNLTEIASLKVRDHPIPENTPPMVRAVLEKKRALGSESTFIAGLIDIPAETAGFVWMGDSRLRLWKGDRALTKPFEGLFKTSERWSTIKGPVGELHLAPVPISDFDYLATYSDGFSYLDTAYQMARLIHPFSDHAINEFIVDAAQRPSSDDISFLEIWTTPALPSFPKTGENLVMSDARYQYRNEAHFLAWAPVAEASGYEIKLSDGNEFTLFTSKVQGCEWQHEGDLDANARLIAVRAWGEHEPGPWSSFQPLQVVAPPALSRLVDVSPIPPVKTGPLPPLLSKTGQTGTLIASPPQTPITEVPPRPQTGRLLNTLPEPSAPDFSAPPSIGEPPKHAQLPQQVAQVTSTPIKAGQTKKTVSGWAWGALALVLLLCFSLAIIGITPGISHYLLNVLGSVKSETPTATIPTKKPTRTATPTVSPSIALTPGGETNPILTGTITPTGTPTPLPTDTIIPSPSYTATFTLTSTQSLPEEQNQVTILSDTVLYLGPDVKYGSSSGVYRSGETLFVIGKYGRWYKLQDPKPSTIGWVYETDLTNIPYQVRSIPENEIEPLPNPEPNKKP